MLSLSSRPAPRTAGSATTVAAQSKTIAMGRASTARKPSFRLVAGSVLLSLIMTMGCDKPSELALEHLHRGDLALAEERHAQALSAYGHAHELAPHDARVQKAQMRARVHLMASSPARVAPESLEDIAYEAALLFDMEPNQKAVWLAAQGNVLARRGDTEGARAKLNEAVAVDAKSHVAHTALGMLFLKERDKLATAKTEFELALQHKPDAAGALFGLGQVKLAEGDLAGAVDKLEAAARRNDDAPTRLSLGTARLRQGKHAEAATELQRALAFEPNNVDALSALGQALLGLGQLEQAEATLRSAMQLRQDQATAIALGFTLTRRGKSEQAVSVFSQVLATDGNVPPALYGAGLANEALGRTAEALGFYQRVLALRAEGPQKDVVLDLQKDAQTRAAALKPKPASSADAGTAPSSAAVKGPLDAR